MGRFRETRSIARRRWFALGILLLVPLALGLVWTSAAPALVFPTLGSQLRASVAAGGSHTLSIAVDGYMRAWGDNSYGQLGDGTMADRLAPTLAGTNTDWVAVAAGENHSLGLREDGSLWAWGLGTDGQLGYDTVAPVGTPGRVGTELEWAAIAAGRDHSLALRSDGSLWAWGSNQDGQLGDGTFIDRRVPTRTGTVTDWVAIAAGGDHSLALKTDGSLWAWGDNIYGQLGDGTGLRRSAPTRIGMDTKWVAITAGGYHSLALKSDGTLWAWGNGASGQLGGGTTTDRSTPTRVGRSTGWVAVAAGGHHTLALQADGTLWAWGSNRYGEVGDGSTIDRPAPVRVGDRTDWVAMAAGSDHSLALDKNHELWAWGRDEQGQLGDGTTSPNRYSPVHICNSVAFFGVIRITTTTSSSSTTSSSTTSSSTTTTTAKPGAKSFSDVPAGHPYHWAISDMAELGIISGYPDGTFRPDNLVLRKHFAKWIVGALEVPVSESDWQDTNPPFIDCGPDDLTDTYPHDFIAVAKQHGLTQGKTANTFAPDANITRAQMATMVVRAAQNFGLTLYPVGAAYSGVFKDYNDATHGANVKLAEYNALLSALVIAGTPSSWIAGNATRGEVAQVLWNLRLLAAH
jgi:alpha-tubulin suppressor-like RCC1 family protein